ncbi:MAG: ABC transporter permease [Candidatus Kerfeldbacteria bacterium]|nr:ABC transporter permease [Candidatus Kerfeldbacteria bacterium]
MKAYLAVIWVLWRRDLLHYWRNRVRAIVGLTMPMLWLFIFGGGMSSSLSQGNTSLIDGISYVQFIFPGVIAMSLIFNAIFSALDTVKDKEFGFLKEILVAPVPRSTIVFGRSLGAASTAAIQATLILILGPFIGVHLTPVMIMLLLPAIWLVALALASIGIVLTALFDNQEGFQFVVNFVNMPMFFLSGALFPLGQLPSWMETVVRLNPASYAVDVMRRIVLTQQHIPLDTINRFSFTIFGHNVSAWIDIIILVGFSAVLLTLAARLFSKPK